MTLFTVDGAQKHSSAIDAWLDEQPEALGAIAREWFARMRACGADVREVMHDGHATACVKNAPFAYVGVFKQHVNVGFFHGDALADPAGLLRGSGKSMRHVRIEPEVAIDEPALSALIADAYRDSSMRVLLA